jgi:HAD superfamily hydrolase (TIGR01509 family)
MPRNIAGYIGWDLDGCLWDSDEVHYLAVNEALKPYGEYISHQEHLAIFKGLPTLRKCQMLTEMGRLPITAHRDVAARKQIATQAVIKQTIRQRPEVTALLLGLKESEWRQCCCSNSVRGTVMQVLLGMGIMDFFDFYLSNEDVPRAKPFPDMYLKAASIFQISPMQMVAVEDANAGQRSALSAGCKLIPITGPQEVEPNLIHRILEEGREITRLNRSELLPMNSVPLSQGVFL